MNNNFDTRKESVLFRKCLGYRDSQSVLSNIHNPDTGETQLIGCLNATVDSFGSILKTPKLSTVYTHTSKITRLSSGSRLFFGDSINVYEYVGGATPVVNRFPILDGPMIHTPIDVRISGATKNYKSKNPSTAMEEIVVGTNPNRATSIEYAKMPLFDGGFVYNARLYTWKDNFLKYSEDYHYDLWNDGDGFIGHSSEIKQAGAIQGVLLVATENEIITYTGTGPSDFVKKTYNCQYINNTLYSGYISKTSGHGHVFMASDGIYLVDKTGSLSRITENNLENVSALNNSYIRAVVHEGKYLAFGGTSCIEYDFQLKAVMIRSLPATDVCLFDGRLYVSNGDSLFVLETEQDVSIPSSITFPYSNHGADGTKSFSDMYFTGVLEGDMEIVCRDQTNTDEPERWSIEISDLGLVQNKRIKLPRANVGSKISFQLNVSSGSTFRAEEIKLVFESGKRM